MDFHGEILISGPLSILYTLIYILIRDKIGQYTQITYFKSTFVIEEVDRNIYFHYIGPYASYIDIEKAYILDQK